MLYILDKRICFGLRSVPYSFSHISNFVVRCMARRGCHNVINYLDDFILVDDSSDFCQEAQMQLISLLGSFGFEVNWEKCSLPSNTCRY